MSPGRPSLRSVGMKLLRKLVNGVPDAKLERRFGSRIAQRAIFTGMARSFVPSAADGFQGEISYELMRPATAAPPLRWTLRVSRRRASARARGSTGARVSVEIPLADFMRVACGEADPVLLVLGGRASVRGDFGLAARMPEMFGLRG